MEETILEIQKNKLEVNIALFAKLAWGSVVIGAIIFICTLLYIIFGNYNAHKDQLNTIGTFAGGSVASFWSLSGLFFIYVAFLGQKLQLLFQQEELRLQREELKATREELEGQRWEMQEQNKTIALQRFENTFFKLVELHIQNKNDVSYIDYTGRAAFREIYTVIAKYIERESKIKVENSSLESTVIGVEKFIADHQSSLISYLNIVVQILKFVINDPNLTVGEKEKYFDYYISILSTFEIIFIYYYLLRFSRERQLVEIIENYSIFKYMDRSLIFNKEHIDYFNVKAYRS